MGIVAVFLLAAEIHSASTKSNRMIALSGAKNLHRDIRRIPMDCQNYSPDVFKGGFVRCSCLFDHDSLS